MTWKDVVWRAAPLLLIIMLTSYFAGDGWGAIPSALVAWGTILLAFATFQLIRENRRIREEEKERESWRRRLEELQHWIEDVLRLESKYPGAPLETAVDSFWHKTDARVLLSNKEYIINEAKLFDSEFTTQPKLTDQIARLSHILEYEDLGVETVKRELQEKCIYVLEAISNLRIKLKL